MKNMPHFRAGRSRGSVLLTVAVVLFVLFAATNPTDAAVVVASIASHGETIAAGLADFVRQVAA
ncbi:hypothetical protein [Parafrankia sp. FMc2]|uniref:hypothetical protein n=1 Tax=Parafrankia sp. FMc2 TaxID=3233196 RepID=UPI0034D5F1F5